MSTDKRSVEWYNQNAANYTKHVRNPKDSIYHSLYEKPAMYRLLPDLQGKSVLSLGCGSGEDSHHLRKQGASKSVGIDISENLINIAQRSYPDCEFQVGDMEYLPFDDASFDFAYSSLAIHYIEDWTQVFREAYRVLKPDSYLLFSCNHPINSAMAIVQDDTDAKISQLSRTVDRHTNQVTISGDYPTHRALTETGDMAVTTWHKSISEICAEAAASGFMIATISEPQPLPEMEELSTKDYATLLKIPFFIIFKLWKPS